MSGLDVTSRRAPVVEKPSITATKPAHCAIDNVYHQFVDDIFYEAGDSWSPVSGPHKSVNKHTPASRDEGLVFHARLS